MTNAEQVIALHRDTGLPVSMCQALLIEANGNREAAIALIRPTCHPDPVLPDGFWDQFKAMKNDPQHNPDPNVNAARIVAEATTDEKSQPADVEAAWLAWSAHIQKVDERGMELLKAAFEAGFDAATTTQIRR